MERDGLAMPRQRDVSGMTIQARRRQYMNAIDGDTLRLVDRRGVTVIEMGIVLEVEGDNIVWKRSARGMIRETGS